MFYDQHLTDSNYEILGRKISILSVRGFNLTVIFVRVKIKTNL